MAGLLLELELAYPSESGINGKAFSFEEKTNMNFLSVSTCSSRKKR
jgi:hypothetical protein